MLLSQEESKTSPSHEHKPAMKLHHIGYALWRPEYSSFHHARWGTSIPIIRGMEPARFSAALIDADLYLF